MDTDIAVFLLSLVLAGLLGFSAHRASVCTVKAVAEVLTTRRSYMLLSFAKSVVWVLTVTIGVIVLLPEARQPMPGWSLSVFALGGGFLFGVGAAINRGCAISTLTRLAGGNLGMVLSLGGLVAGAAAYVLLAPRLAIPAPVPVADPYLTLGVWGPILGVAALIWALWEATYLWRSRGAGAGWRARALSARYRLSTAAALMGLSNGILYAANGRWAYTGTVSRWVDGMVGTGHGPSATLWALFAAMVVGMVLSARQRGGFRVAWRPSLAWLRYLAGGLLMGVGVAMVPGGNDMLILHGIPGLSPHALPAYGAMIVGIAAVMAMMPLMGIKPMPVDCSGDICREE